jgi:hypothetical protein
MSKKDLIAKLLDKLSEEELEGLLAEDDEDDIEEPEAPNTHVINKNKPKTRRRGGGHRKSQKGRARVQPIGRGKSRQSKGRACRSEPIRLSKKRPNKFEELFDTSTLDADEKQELKEASKTDKVRRRSGMRKRKRRGTLVDVVCRSCNREETVSASLVANGIERYKCNDCSGSACD